MNGEIHALVYVEGRAIPYAGRLDEVEVASATFLVVETPAVEDCEPVRFLFRPDLVRTIEQTTPERAARFWRENNPEAADRRYWDNARATWAYHGGRTKQETD